jgi:solute carrier family 13 (sodium-dependent dicarboxylate transporter), member 2/3/5
MKLGHIKPLPVAVGVLVFCAVAFIPSPLHHFGVYGARPAYAAATALMMAIWWLTEALPIYYTACIPLIFFPLFGVFGKGIGGDTWEAIKPYFDPYIFLFAGGMCIAAAMQQWDLHRRIALKVMSAIGTEPKRLLFGFLCATGFVSMWISNTATAAMMLPIGIAIVSQLEHQLKRPRLPFYGMAIMLAIAYGSNIGGMGTKIGTAPNAQFSGFMHQMGVEISFLQFMAVGLPFVLIMLPIAWYMLWRVARKDGLHEEIERDVISGELQTLGKIKREEEKVLLVFLLTAAAWIFAKDLVDLLKPLISDKLTTAHIEGGVSAVAALVLIALRSHGKQILTGKSLKTVPWETLLLLGGGFAMAAGIQMSGLSLWIAEQLVVLRTLTELSQIFLTSLSSVGLSAVASNTATTAVLLVVIRDTVSPEIVNSALFTVTLAASCDFALPAGTPPNAIVFGSGYVTIPQMARTGVLLDIIAAVIVALWCYLIVPLIL